jgi:hypothetical protein
MNTHLQTLLNSSGIAKRNVGMSLLGAYKISGNINVPQLISPVNQMLRPFNTQTPCQKLIHRFWLHAFSLSKHPASMRPF